MKSLTKEIAPNLTVCDDDFQHSLEAARLKLTEARGFMTAAQAQRQAHVLVGSTLPVDEGDSDFLMTQTREAVSEALSMLQDPSILADPSMASERAQLILQGASIAAGFDQLGRLTQSCLELLTVDFGGYLPSKTELALSEQALWAERAREYLGELSKRLSSAKTNCKDSVGLFDLSASHFSPGFLADKWASAYYRERTNGWQRWNLRWVAVSSSDIPLLQVIGWQGMVLREIALAGYAFDAILRYDGGIELTINISLTSANSRA
jgi:hypothetical protein